MNTHPLPCTVFFTLPALLLLFFSFSAHAYTPGPFVEQKAEMLWQEQLLNQNHSYSIKPVLVDLDADNDLDLILGASDNNGRGLRWFENTGDAARPVFIERNGTDNPLVEPITGFYSAPALADLDADGDFDLVVGQYGGNLKWFENRGNPAMPRFIERTGEDNPLHWADVGDSSTPALADLDADGDFDLLVGEQGGTLNWFENIGDPTTPVFSERSGSNPLHGINANGKSAPAPFDLDIDGDFDLLIGTSDGGLRWFENRGGATVWNTTPSYTTPHWMPKDNRRNGSAPIITLTTKPR